MDISISMLPSAEMKLPSHVGLFCVACLQFHELGLGWAYLETNCFCCVASFVRFIMDVLLRVGKEANVVGEVCIF